MNKRTAHIAISDGLSDWETGHLLAELRTGRFTGVPFDVATVAESSAPITTMGGLRIVPDTLLDDLDPDDGRRALPRFSADSIAANLALVDRVRAIAEARGATPGQVALAWVAAQGAVPIPGTKRRAYLEENARAAGVELTAAELGALEGAVPTGAVSGARDTEEGLALTDR